MDTPHGFHITFGRIVPDRYDSHLERRLSSMKGQYSDEQAFARLAQNGDPVLYEVYELARPAVHGELLSGISILHPGKVGNEYYMTKGHFHQLLETAEVYYCLAGRGRMVTETPEGDWAVEELAAGKVLYVPPRWAHRSVNTSENEDLVTLFVYPAEAGHDYKTIETRGFRKLILDLGKGPEVVDNPAWGG